MSERDEVPDWQLELYLLAGLPAEEARTVGSALERDAELRERLAALERSNQEILSRDPPATMARRIAARLEGSAPVRRSAASGRGWLLATGVVGTIAVALLVRTGGRFGPTFDPHAGGDVTQVKGVAPELVLFRQSSPAGVERLQPKSVAHQGDLLQVAYRAVGRRYGVIVSIDGRGVVTRHLPAGDSSAASLKRGAAVPLPEAYALDDAPGFERFYFVAADQPFAVDLVVEAVRRQHRSGSGLDPNGPLELPRSMDQSTFLINKETLR